MRFSRSPLVLTDHSISDALGTISLDDLPDPQPANPLRLADATPLMERLWRIALTDIESNIVSKGGRRYFGAGTDFGVRIYTRDISFSGVLGLNELYPDIMLESLKLTRDVRLGLGFRVSRGYTVPGVAAPWVEEDVPESEFMTKYDTNGYTRRTDDVVWLWCAGDLLSANEEIENWQWVYETGKRCFAELYAPFFDRSDGLYRGQATFVDIHFSEHKATGYPAPWSIADCVLIKSTSTNCLYVKGLDVMAAACRRLGQNPEARNWQERAVRLRQAIRRELRLPDGTFAYLKNREGSLENRRDALGTAFAVLTGVVSGEESIRALRDYPLTDAGVPLFDPFFPSDNWYHNNSSWPFADTFFLQALERSTGQDYTALNAALLARTCVDGSFHEVVDLRDKTVRGSGRQLWTAAAFLNTCRRAGLRRIAR